MIKLTVADLPAHFHSVLIYARSREAFGANTVADIDDGGEVFKLSFDDTGALKDEVAKTAWWNAIMPSRMGGEEYTVVNAVKTDELPQALFKSLQDYYSRTASRFEGYLKDDDLSPEEKTVFRDRAAVLRRKYKLDAAGLA